MTALTRTAIRPFYARVSIERLSQLARVLAFAEKSVMALAIGLTSVIGAQLIYPSDRTLPFQQLGSTYIGFKTTEQITDSLQSYKASQIVIQINNKQFASRADKAGIAIDVPQASAQLKSYSVWQRLIPGSIFRQNTIKDIPTRIDTSKQQILASTVAKLTTKAPKNASLERLPDGNYKLLPQVTGLSTKQSEITDALSSLDPVIHRAASITTSAQTPPITDRVVSAAIRQYDQARKSPLTLSYNSKDYVITPEQITAWSLVKIDESAKTATVTFDQAAIRAWLNSSVPSVIQAPGVTTITIVNGKLQSRTEGQPGQGLDPDNTVNAIISALKNTEPSVSASVKAIAPQEKYVRQYSHDNDGLNAIIADWLKDYPGIKAGVALRELGGVGRQASLNADTRYAAASLYKLYTDWYVFNQSEQGKLNLGEASGVPGKNIIQCIEASIVVSDNPCGKALGERFGWSTINAFANGSGYPNTSLPGISTANDTANYMLNLANGRLMNPSNTQTLLDYMQRQVYRSGIPAGSAGAAVQDKVGFLSNVWNDAAIVRGPKSSYVLVIYTNRTNADAIKDLASRIYNLMQS